MLKNALNVTVNLQTRKWSNRTQFLIFLDFHQFKKGGTGISRRIVRSLLTNCLELLLFGTNWTPDILWSVNNLARSVTKWTPACDRRLARLIFIPSSIVNIVMWETKLNNADKDYFKILILQDTLRIQSQLQEVSCVFLETEHLCQQVGCARNQLHCLTVPQNRKLFRWMLVCEWTGSLLLIHGMWWSRCCVQLRITFNLGHTGSGKLGQIQPNHTSSRNLSIINPTGQFEIPKPRTNTSVENKGWAVERSG